MVLCHLTKAEILMNIKRMLPVTETYQTKTLCILPMFHAFNNVAVLPTLRAGGHVITVPNRPPHQTNFIEALIQYKVIIIALLALPFFYAFRKLVIDIIV